MKITKILWLTPLTLLKDAIENAFTTRSALNKATGNPATAYYTAQGSYVAVDDVTKEIVQVSDRFDPLWRPDSSIINPFVP
jgi:hypothetical protein